MTLLFPIALAIGNFFARFLFIFQRFDFISGPLLFIPVFVAAMLDFFAI